MPVESNWTTITNQIWNNLDTILMALGILVVSCEALVRTLAGAMKMVRKLAVYTATTRDDDFADWVILNLGRLGLVLQTVARWLPRGTVPAVEERKRAKDSLRPTSGGATLGADAAGQDQSGQAQREGP